MNPPNLLVEVCPLCCSEEFLMMPVGRLTNPHQDRSHVVLSEFVSVQVATQYRCAACGHRLQDGVVRKCFVDIYRVRKFSDKALVAKKYVQELGADLHFVVKYKKEALLLSAHLNRLGSIEGRYSYVQESQVIPETNVFCMLYKEDYAFQSEKNYIICLTDSEFERRGISHMMIEEKLKDSFYVRFRSMTR